MISPAVYILANARNGALYIGSTSNLPQRVWLHKSGLVDGFSKNIACICWCITSNTKICTRQYAENDS